MGGGRCENHLMSQDGECVLSPQSNELTRGTTELLQHFRLYGEFTMGARAMFDVNLIWFVYITRLSRGGEGDNLLVRMISTCLRCA